MTAIHCNIINKSSTQVYDDVPGKFLEGNTQGNLFLFSRISGVTGGGNNGGAVLHTRLTSVVLKYNFQQMCFRAFNRLVEWVVVIMQECLQLLKKSNIC